VALAFPLISSGVSFSSFVVNLISSGRSADFAKGMPRASRMVLQQVSTSSFAVPIAKSWIVQHGSFHSGDLLGNVPWIGTPQCLFSGSYRRSNGGPHVSPYKYRFPRQSGLFNYLESIPPQILIVQLTNPLGLRWIRSHNGMNCLAKKCQERLVITVKKIKSRIVENLIVVPIKISHAMLPNVARGIGEASIC